MKTLTSIILIISFLCCFPCAATYNFFGLFICLCLVLLSCFVALIQEFNDKHSY
jgi:hypothetical protein